MDILGKSPKDWADEAVLSSATFGAYFTFPKMSPEFEQQIQCELESRYGARRVNKFTFWGIKEHDPYQGKRWHAVFWNSSETTKVKRNWVKCSERMPKTDDRVWLVATDCRSLALACFVRGRWNVCGLNYGKVTHWLDEELELPEDV